ncbi:MAG TPA: hypothetical protein VE152_13250, partial [Acidimicrobiales bacterium]|nr:hypothetical protein [Acidimicrobiales bacterium]
PGEGRSLRPAWTALVSALRQLPATVLVDLGRCSPGEPLFQAVAPCADTAVVVVRADLAAVSHARALAASWPPEVPPGVVVVGDTPYRPHDVARVTGLDLLGAVPHNRNAAEAELLGQWGPGGRSLRRSVARLADTLAARCDTAGAAPVPDASAPARLPVGAEPPTTEEAGG